METKICNKCNIEMIVEAFPKRGKKGLSPYCKPCKKLYDKEFYQKTLNTRRKNKKENSKEIRKRNAQYIWDYLKQNPCVDCGENDPTILEFDHRDSKKYNISEMTTNSIDNIRTEIEKCDVRCVKCHRRKTAKQFGWYKEITG